ncbi:MAG: GAF domain-containing SpoIIE family protein phosphatase [Acidimicrobiales bacterium]
MSEPAGDAPAADASAPGTALAFAQRVVDRLARASTVAGAATVAAAGLRDALWADAVAVHLLSDDGALLVPVALEGVVTDLAELASGPVPLDADVPAAAVLRRGEPAFWRTIADRDKEHPTLAGAPSPWCSWVFVPLVGQPRPVGMVSMAWSIPAPLGNSNTRLVEIVAAACALAIDRVHLGEARRVDRETLELLSEGTRLMANALDPRGVVDRLVRLAVPRLAQFCAVYVAGGGSLRRVAVEVEGRPELSTELRDPAAMPLASPTVLALAFRTGARQVVPVVDEQVVDDLYADPQARTVLDGAGGWTALVVPVSASGRVIGVMSLASGAWRGRPPPHVVAAAEGLAARAGTSLVHARRFEYERRIAAELTQALLPATLPAVPGYQVAARYLPAGSPVAGDWFDTVRLPSGRYLVAVGDAGGHGIPAASLMAKLRNAARGLAIAGSSPAEILHALNLLTASEGGDDFATAVYSLLEPGTGKLTWSHAGHLPPLVVRRRGAGTAAGYAERPSHPPLGWPAAGKPPEGTLHLRPGDALVLVTDGVVERRGEELGSGLERLRHVVGQRGDADADELTDRIVGSIGPHREDDCCVLVLRRSGLLP